MDVTPPPLPPPQLLPAAQSAFPSGRSSSRVGRGLMVVLWLAWLGVTLAADFFAFLMFAFADSPGANRAAQAMIGPVFVWFAVAFVAGAVLLVLRRPWQVALAFALAASPPLLVFAGYNLLAGAAGGGGSVRPAAGGPAAAPATPAPVIPVPPGGFRPPPMKAREPIDFRQHMPVDSTTRPAATRPADRPPATSISY